MYISVAHGKLESNHLPEKIVHVVLFCAVNMCGVGGHGVDCQIALDVVDNVRWVIHVSHTRCRRSAKV